MADEIDVAAARRYPGPRRPDRPGRRPTSGALARIAARVAGDAAEVGAWLHDVVEDCDDRTLDRFAEGISADLGNAVDAISKRVGEASDDYYPRVAANPLALKVKYADLADNGDPVRLARLDPATRDRLAGKYAHAREVLASLVG